jgi:hypothetical protein
MHFGAVSAVQDESHVKFINTHCGQSARLVTLKLAVHIVTTGLWNVKPGTSASPVLGVGRLRLLNQ